MKTIPFLTAIAAGALLAAAPLRADDPEKQPTKETAGEPKKEGGEKKPGMEKMKEEMEARMKAKMEAMKAKMEGRKAEKKGEDPEQGMKAGMKEKMEAMKAKEKADGAEFERLFDAMNSSVGDKKIEAIAAILNKMAQKEKAMKAKCEEMMKDGMKGGMMKKDGTPGAKADEPGYFTCTMHPAIRWPVPGKCPICEMALVPVPKKEAGAKHDAAKPAPDAKPEAKSGEEPKKPADPHAGHH